MGNGGDVVTVVALRPQHVDPHEPEPHPCSHGIAPPRLCRACYYDHGPTRDAEGDEDGLWGMSMRGGR